MIGDGCGGGRSGSGWIARNGIVVTNAHVVAQTDRVWTQLRGKGTLHTAEVIWFDPVNDVAVVRSTGLAGVPAMRLGRDPKGNSHAAVLGYPGGGPFRTSPARTGAPTRDPAIRVNGKPIKNKFIPFRSPGVRPGSSGGPIVDLQGRVRAMVFAGGARPSQQGGVPTGPIRRALRRAGPPVGTGSCD
jgi:S1-C subfamily serine protease